ncbi:MAG: DUF2946 domain-containing protein [Burkholderiales bacterium]
MKAGGLFHRQLAWVILFVVVFSALAPFISKLLANSKSIYWTEICTTSGTKLVAIDLNTKNIPDTVSKDNHCNYCFPKNYLSALPTTPFLWGGTRLIIDRQIISFSQTNNKNRNIHNAHPPRAPPQFF